MGRPRLALAVCLLLPLLARGAAAEDPAVGADDVDPTEVSAPEVSAEARDEALKKAFAYLDEEIWKGAPNPAQRHYVLATAGWAFLLAEDRGSGKRLPSRKKQLGRIEKALAQYASRVADHYERDDAKRQKKRRRDPPPGGPGSMPSGMPPGMPPGMSMGAMETVQFVWPLSMTAHFFAERAARGKRRGAKTVLSEIVAVLEASQQANGGWGHDDASRPGMGLPPMPLPKPPGIEGFPTEYPGTLLGATNCALSALAAAQRALGRDDGEHLERGRAYYAASQSRDGTFPYDPSQDYGRQALPDGARRADGAGAFIGAIDTARTGGAVLALHLAGAAADDPVLVRAVEAIDRHVEYLSESHGSASMGLQLGALAMRLRGDEAWARFRRAHFARMIAAQEASGAFPCACQKLSAGTTCDTEAPGGGNMPAMPGMAGYASRQKVYVTAIYALILALDRTAPRALPALAAPTAPVTTGD